MKGEERQARVADGNEMTKSEYRRKIKLKHDYPILEYSWIENVKDTVSIRNLYFLQIWCMNRKVYLNLPPPTKLGYKGNHLFTAKAITR